MNPSGKIAFSSGRSVDFDIWMYSFETDSISKVTRGDYLNDYPALSVDGKQLIYVSTQSDLIPSLWLNNLDGSPPRQLTSGYFCRSPVFTPDGKAVVYSANALDGNNIDLFKLNLVDPEAKPELLLSSLGAESDPCVSPDGSKVVFTKHLSGNNSEIAEYDVNSKITRILASHSARDCSPVYSPDGNRIIFVSHRADFDQGKFNQLNKQIVEAIAVSDMRTVDRLILELNRLEGDSEIFIMLQDGTELKQLTSNKSVDKNPCWSPCGKYICYTSSSSSENETERLMIMEIDSGVSRALSIDRTLLEADIGASCALNKGLLTRLIPDWLEKKFVNKSFWGEERNPSWSR